MIDIALRQNAEKDFNSLFAKANDAFNSRDFQSARTYYSNALDKVANFPDKKNLKALALLALAKTHIELNQNEEAAKACSQALVIMRKDYKPQGADYEKRDGLAIARASLLLGRIYRKQEKNAEAEEAFKYALRLEEDCLGPLYLKDEIIQSYTELLKHQHRDAFAARLARSDNESYFSIYEQVKIAHHLISKGNVKEAAEQLSETAKFAVENNLVTKDTIECLATLADVSLKLKDYDQAAKAIDQELQLLPRFRVNTPLTYVRAYSTGAAAQTQLGQLDKSNEYLRQALDICLKMPEGECWGYKGKVYMQFGTLKFKQHDLKASQDNLSKSLAIFTKYGAGQEAIDQVKKALQDVKAMQSR